MKRQTKQLIGASMIVLSLLTAYFAMHAFYMEGLYNGVRRPWLEPSVYVILIIIFVVGWGLVFSRKKPVGDSND
jgi:hypothetical protein